MILIKALHTAAHTKLFSHLDVVYKIETPFNFSNNLKFEISDNLPKPQSQQRHTVNQIKSMNLMPKPQTTNPI